MKPIFQVLGTAILAALFVIATLHGLSWFPARYRFEQVGNGLAVNRYDTLTGEIKAPGSQQHERG